MELPRQMQAGSAAPRGREDEARRSATDVQRSQSEDGQAPSRQHGQSDVAPQQAGSPLYPIRDWASI